jgi:hypothetical protein
MAWLVLSAGPVLAHNGEDHAGDGSGGLTWLGMVAVAAIVALAYGVARRGGPEGPDVDPDAREKLDGR